jgi:O-antigen ligase
MGAMFGLMEWSRRSRRLEFGAVHLLALATVLTTLISALGAANRQVALLKCLSLFLLFLYLSIGSRVVLPGREALVIRKVLVISQVAVIVCGLLYVAGLRYWYNSNSLGAITGMIAFPVVLWGWLIASDHAERRFAAFALMICAILLLLSRARAGMLAAGISGAVILYSLRRFRTVAVATCLLGVFFLAFFLATPESFQDYAQTVIFKPSETNSELSVLGSRRAPWQTAIKTIRENPWFGTGLGTPDKTVGGTFTTSSYREHGNSYLTVLEGLGLLGVLPFALLLVILLYRIWMTCLWMRRTRNPAHIAVPLVGVIVAGMVHAGFEDWLLSAGSYLCIVFWIITFWALDLTGKNALPVRNT